MVHGPTRVNIPNGIAIGLAAFVGLTVVTDRPTDKPTDYITPSVAPGALQIGLSLRPPYEIWQAITFCPVVSFFFLSSFFFFCSSPNLSDRRLDDCLPYVYTWCGPSTNLECRSEMCCTRLAGNAGPKKSPKIRHLGTIAQLCRAISSQLRHVSTTGKNC